MERRQFLQTTLAIGAAMLPGGKLTASGLLSPSPMVEPSMPIWDAALGGHWGIVKEWLQRDPTLINVTGMDGRSKASLLHLAIATENPDMELLKYLVSLGADVSAWFEVPNENGISRAFTPPPTHCAIHPNSNIDIIKFLVDQCDDINDCKSGQTLLHDAARYDDMVVLKYLIERGADVNAKCEYGWTPLYYTSNVETMQYLISVGADVETDALLHRCAAGDSSVERLQCLINAGADVNARFDTTFSRLDGTPLHWAAHYNRHAGILKYLISVGADVHATDNEGKTPLEVAKTEEKKRILREAMDRQTH